jgi:thiamine pyridinylase
MPNPNTPAQMATTSARVGQYDSSGRTAEPSGSKLKKGAANAARARSSEICHGAGEAVSAGRLRTRLIVSLTNLMPDAANDGNLSLCRWLKREFEAQHPNVDLQFKRMNPGDDLFSVDGGRCGLIGELLTSPRKDDASGGVDVAEVDTIPAETLVQSKVIRSWSALPDSDDWHPAGRESGRIDGLRYAAPHWLCMHTLISRPGGLVASARGAWELVSLAREGSVRLAGKTGGRWNGPMLYLNAYCGVHGSHRAYDGLNINLDEPALRGFRALGQACRNAGQMPGASANAETACLFANRQSDGFIGYTESLQQVLRLKRTDEELLVTPLVFREGQSPLVAVDGFVLRADCSGEVERAARAFVEFMNLPDTMRFIVMSLDAGPKSISRYLLPATKSAYQDPVVSRDLYYHQFERMIADAVPYPIGFYEFAKSVHAELELQLQVEHGFADAIIRHGKPSKSEESFGRRLQDRQRRKA